MKKTIKYMFVILQILMLFCATNCSGEKNDSQSDVPVEYSDLIYNKYKNMIENICSEKFEEYINNEVPVEWFYMAIDAPKGDEKIQKTSYGYALKDINNDGIEELFLIREDYFVLAIYTLSENKPYLLDCFNYRHKGMVLDTGEIYTITTGSGEAYHKIRKLEKNSTTLTQMLSFGYDVEVGYFFQKDIDKVILDSDEYIALRDNYPELYNVNIKNDLINSGVLFTPVFDGS